MGQSKQKEQNENPLEGRWEQESQFSDPPFATTFSWQLLHINLNIGSQNTNFARASFWTLTPSIISDGSVFMLPAKLLLALRISEKNLIFCIFPIYSCWSPNIFLIFPPSTSVLCCIDNKIDCFLLITKSYCKSFKWSLVLKDLRPFNPKSQQCTYKRW